MVVGIPVLILVFLNWWSGGAVLNFVELAVSGESTGGTSAPSYVAPAAVADEPPQAEIDLATQGAWDCYYDPTMNNDWHDDVICRDGVDSLRPILLPESGFVTEDEMIAAGEAYEVELNR